MLCVFAAAALLSGCESESEQRRREQQEARGEAAAFFRSQFEMRMDRRLPGYADTLATIETAILRGGYESRGAFIGVDDRPSAQRDMNLFIERARARYPDVAARIDSAKAREAAQSVAANRRARDDEQRDCMEAVYNRERAAGESPTLAGMEAGIEC